MGDEGGYIGPAFCQRRDVYPDDCEPPIEIGTEATLRDRSFQIDIGGGNDPDIDRDGPAAAKPLYFACFKHAEQFDLHVSGQIADFIQEERAAICGFKLADAGFGGAGVSAGFGTEQLTFGKIGGDCPAVDGLEAF